MTIEHDVHPKPRRTRPRMRRLTTLALALALPLSTVALPAQAAIGSATTHIGEKYGTGVGYWFGSYELNNDETVFCAIQPGNQVGPPALLNGGRIKPTYGPKKLVTSHQAVKNSGSKVTVDGKIRARIAYIVSRWGETSSKERAIAIERLVLQKTGVGMTAAAERNTAWTQDTVDSMWSESAKYYGPYTMSDLSLKLAKNQKTATLSGIGAKSQAGNWMNNYTTKLTITGDAVWAANDKKTLEVDSHTSGISRTINIQGAGKISVKMQISGLREHRLVIREALESSISGNTPQDIMVAGIAQSVSSTKTVTSTATPKITTQTSHKTTTPGSKITDKLTVSAASGVWPDGQKVTVTSTLWGPLAKAPTLANSVPSGTPKVGSVNTVVDGPGTYTTPAVTLPNSKGHYVWTESAPATGNVAGWTSQYGVASEITEADWNKFEYSISTQTSKATAAKGDSLTDKLSVKVTSGTWVPNHKITVTSTLWGPFTTKPTLANSVPTNAPKVSSVNTTITGPGDFTTPAIKLPTKSGYYVWTETAAATSYAPAWASKFGVPSEITVVPWTPTVATIAQLPVVDVANKEADLSDNIRIDGAKPNSAISGKAVLYYAGVTQPSQTLVVPADAVEIGSVTFSALTDAFGNARLVSAPVTLGAGYLDGYYTWVVSIDGTNDGLSAYTSPFGVESETQKIENLFAYPPYATTRTSQAIAEPGDWIFDQMVIHDPADLIKPDRPLAMTSTLWGPITGAGIGDTVPTGTNKVGEVTVEITDAGAYDTPSVQLPLDAEKGLYAWTYSYPDNGGVVAYDPALGHDEYIGRNELGIVEEEATRLPWSPRVETQTSHPVAVAGTALTDELEIYDARPNVAIDVESTLYGPFTDKPVLSAAVPAGAPVVGTVSTQVTPDANGRATAETDPLTVPSEGYYVWVETIAESTDKLSLAWQSQFGIASETTLVRWQPTVTTVASHAIADVDMALSDILTVSGLKPGHSVDVVSTLWGPFTTAPTLSAAIPANAPKVGTVTTTVSGDGTYTTDTLDVVEGGFYVWTEMIAETPEIIEWQSPFGIASETTFVRYQPKIVTQTSHEVAVPQTAISDKLTVSGLRDDMTLTVESTLYGPLATRPTESSTIPVDAPVAGTVTTTVTGNGDFTTDAVTVSDPGFYTWVDEIVEGPENSEWVSRFGVPSETTLVQWQPEVATVSSHQNVVAGSAIHDTLEIVGLDPAATVDVISRLYGPFDMQPQLSDDVPANAPLVGEVTTVGVGNGEHTTPSLVVPSEGYYVWVETIAAANGQAAWTSQFGIGSETTLVKWTPLVQTRTSHPSVEPPAEISDHLQMSNAAPSRTYTVESTLWGPFESRQARTAQEPDAKYKVTTLTTKLVTDSDGNATGETAKVKLTSEGFFFWSETIFETDESFMWQSDFWIESETTIAKWQPTVVTETSHIVATPGTTIYDKIKVSNIPTGETLEVVSTLWGPLDAKPERMAHVPAGTPAVGTVTTQVAATDNEQWLDTEGVTISALGYYVWTETIAETGETSLWQSDFGIAEETTLIPWTPTIETRTSEKDSEATLEIFDHLRVTNAKPNSQITVTSTLWGPFDEKPQLRATVPDGAPMAGQVTTVITGNGDYTTPTVELPGVGWFVWTETAEGTADSLEWASPFGVESEITYASPYSGGGGGDEPPGGGGGQDGPQLPDTGANVKAFVFAALALLLAGVGAVAVRSRRRSHTE